MDNISTFYIMLVIHTLKKSRRRIGSGVDWSGRYTLLNKVVKEGDI